MQTLLFKLRKMSSEWCRNRVKILIMNNFLEECKTHFSENKQKHYASSSICSRVQSARLMQEITGLDTQLILPTDAQASPDSDAPHKLVLSFLSNGGGN